jgi:hypothetical protein
VSGVSVLDGLREVDDRPQMTDTQIKTARRRLALGISNVGFWVLVSTAGLAWLSRSNTPPTQQTDLFKLLLAAVALQGFFDWVGGTVLMPPSPAGAKGFLSRWSRGVLVHTALLAATGVLSYWSYRLSGGFCLGVTASLLALFWVRRRVLQLLSGAPVRPSSAAGRACWSAAARDPSFTGGICGAGQKATVLLPEPWERSLTGSEMETVVQRRLWEIQNQLPARALLFVLSWNLAGCGIGSLLLDLPGRAPEPALLLQCCWMTLWGFLGLLLLPTASRSAVFAADRAAAAKGCDAAGWIQRFPEITGEDGNAKTVLQRVFYPIPSARERLLWLGKSPSLPVLGGVARMNLFLSLGTLTLLGRCVHCNVGRPELWVFPPSD